MELDFAFFFNSILLGVGLAMDAFSVSVASGLRQPDIPKRQIIGRSSVFGFFQFAMPMVGWVCVHTIVEKFRAFEKFIPWIALILLGYIGGKMLVEGVRKKKDGGDGEELCPTGVGFWVLMMQGVATSIDALSVGFTISDYTLFTAVLCSVLVAVTTFVICVGGFVIGRTVGDRLSGRAEVLGGAILVFIGLEIFIKGVF